MVLGPSPLQWICRERVQKLGSDEATACFGDEKHTESGGPTSQGEGTLARGREWANPSRSHRNLLPFSGPPPPSWSSPILCEISVIIYPSLPFILLLHLLIIHAHHRVHVSSAILSGALWVAVAPLALSRGHIHSNGVRVSAVSI